MWFETTISRIARPRRGNAILRFRFAESPAPKPEPRFARANLTRRRRTAATSAQPRRLRQQLPRVLRPATPIPTRSVEARAAGYRARQLTMLSTNFVEICFVVVDEDCLGFRHDDFSDFASPARIRNHSRSLRGPDSCLRASSVARKERNRTKINSLRSLSLADARFTTCPSFAR